ncbi:MAG: PorT family protein [Flammeovirgaceae bacterium]|nr:PorT family protein [Flammeovirgaceae bacterium]
MRSTSILLLLLIFPLLSHGQARNTKRKSPSTYNLQNREANKFLEKQWWLGFKAGMNWSRANVDQTYDVISPTNYSLAEKQYNNFKDPGITASLEITFYYKGFSFSLQPTYRNSNFSYSTHYEWDDDEEPTNRLELDYNQEQRIDYAEFPLLVRYDITNTRLRPYVQVGAYYTLLINANKSVEVSGIDYASGGTNHFTDEPIIVGAKDLFAQYQWGLMGGVGANYHLGNIRINLDVTYRQGMSLANSTENRFANQKLSGVGDAMDDFKLNSFAIMAGVMFPLRYLSGDFKSLDF